MKIKKSDLDYLLSKVMPGVGDNKLFPLTTFLGIKYNEGYITLCGTDSVNTIYSSKWLNYKEEDFKLDICVKAELFSKLISKITTTEIEINLEENSLNIVGNGSYNIAIVLDDEGNYVKFPIKEPGSDASEEANVVSKFKDLKLYNEKSLCKNPENHILNGYYVDNEIAITTDRVVMTLFNEIFLQEPIVLKKSFVDLVVNLNNDIVINRWEKDEVTNIYVTDGETEIYSTSNCNVEKYPTNQVQKTVGKMDFSMEANISLKELSSALDRLSLFLTKGNTSVLLKTENDNLIVEESNTKTFETIELKNLNEEKEWSGRLDVNLLLEQIKAFKNDEVKICLGNDTAIKFVEGNVTKLICLMN